jgi:trehalose-6-phosphate synthase
VFDYARHFLSSCLRVLPDVQVTPTSVTMAGRTTRVVVYPIGIEPSAFSNIVVTDKCQARIAELSAKFAGMRVIVSVDRLDPIKGEPSALLP